MIWPVVAAGYVACTRGSRERERETERETAMCIYVHTRQITRPGRGNVWTACAMNRSRFDPTLLDFCFFSILTNFFVVGISGPVTFPPPPTPPTAILPSSSSSSSWLLCVCVCTCVCVIRTMYMRLCTYVLCVRVSAYGNPCDVCACVCLCVLSACKCEERMSWHVLV